MDEKVVAKETEGENESEKVRRIEIADMTKIMILVVILSFESFFISLYLCLSCHTTNLLDV